MKKILFAIFSSITISSYAETIYLNEHYTVALDNATLESNTNTINIKTLSPIVYKDYYLPIGTAITMSCDKNNHAIVSKIDTYNTKIPVSIGNGSKIEFPCDNKTMPDMIWVSDDDYKIKSDNVKQVSKATFSIIPFTAKNMTNDGQITGISTDGNLTIISVNKTKYFNGAQFFADIKGKMYFLQSTNRNDKFIVHGADFDKLLITDSSGQLISSVEFPNFD
ncbi:MAG: hypothetical protein PHC75_08395 [Burkholderiales bacterium]|nr:hypothetical protein [Burkholderiales bacterium]